MTVFKAFNNLPVHNAPFTQHVISMIAEEVTTVSNRMLNAIIPLAHVTSISKNQHVQSMCRRRASTSDGVIVDLGVGKHLVAEVSAQLGWRAQVDVSADYFR